MLDRGRGHLRELHEDRLVLLAELAGLLVREVDEPEVAAVATDERRGQPAAQRRLELAVGGGASEERLRLQLGRPEANGPVLAADERNQARVLRPGLGAALLELPFAVATVVIGSSQLSPGASDVTALRAPIVSRACAVMIASSSSISTVELIRSAAAASRRSCSPRRPETSSTAARSPPRIDKSAPR